MTPEDRAKYEKMGLKPEQIDALEISGTPQRDPKRKKVEYVDLVAAYDIETSSFYYQGEKCAATYHHAIIVDRVIHRFRYMQDFLMFLSDLARQCEAEVGKRHLVVYVQYLSYEFGFTKHSVDLADVFATGDKHHVLKAVTTEGIEFRCSAALSGMTLQQMGEEVGIKKMVGDIDHTLIRHAETPLTEEELKYIDNDVLILDAYIRKMLVDDTLATIPMTKTGYIRRMVRKAVLKDKGYAKKLASMPLNVITYVMATTAFQGGYTHANAQVAGKILTEVGGMDLASSYPASLVQFMFPMSNFEDVRVADMEQLEKVLSRCAALIDVTLHGVSCNYNFPAISESKCSSITDPVVDNGRVYCATTLRMIMTDVDWRTIRKNYSFDAVTVHKVMIAAYDYLPTVLVESILKLYAEKTMLKDVEGMEDQYNQAKVSVNGVFGMVATDPVRVSFDLVGQDLVAVVDPIEESLDEHNKNRSRFLYYPWAAWITAYSRYVLLDALMRLEDAGVVVAYCDTDSVYYKFVEIAMVIFTAINAEIVARMWMAMRHHGFDDETAENYISPRDKDGQRHTLGVFEDDTHGVLIEEFKTLGAKRYAKWTRDDKGRHFEITVAGLKKGAGDHKVKDENGKKRWVQGYVTKMGAMDFFRDGMEVSAEHSGRLVHTYSDAHVSGVIEDHLEVEGQFEQKGFIHLEPSGYRMGLSGDYRNFIQKFTEDGIYQ